MPLKDRMAALKVKFQQYPHVVLLLGLIEMKQATNPVFGLRARLRTEQIPQGLRLNPVLRREDGNTIFEITPATLEQLSLSEIPERDLQWVNAVCEQFAQGVATEPHGGRA